MAITATDLTVVVGLARSGIGAAKLLRHRGQPVLVIESQTSPELEAKAAELQQLGIEVQLGTPLSPETFAALTTAVRSVVVSPGIRWDHPTLAWLRQQGICVQGEMELAFGASGGVPWIGITGTNGKTTVTHLVSHLLRHGGLDAPMGGNVGFSATELVLARLKSGAPPDWLVMELSSYQIEAAPKLAPRIGIWTTLTPDHLERHGTLEAYRAIKRQLLENSALRLLNADDPDLRAHAASWNAARCEPTKFRRIAVGRTAAGYVFTASTAGANSNSPDESAARRRNHWKMRFFSSKRFTFGGLAEMRCRSARASGRLPGRRHEEVIGRQIRRSEESKPAAHERTGRGVELVVFGCGKHQCQRWRCCDGQRHDSRRDRHHRSGA